MKKQEKIVNYVRINGERVLHESLPESVRREIGRDIAVRFAKGFGYEPVNEKKEVAG